MSESELRSWLGAFVRAKGRPLRVLHIGNIANNAYNNAKLQRRVGIEADVVCYGYYHVMGSPEWEDAEFEGEVDETHPDWQAVNLGGFKRPKWFVQGPLDHCLGYLSARHKRAAFRAWLRWYGLAISYRQLLDGLEREGCRKTPRAQSIRGAVRVFIMRSAAAFCRLLRWAKGVPARWRTRIFIAIYETVFEQADIAADGAAGRPFRLRLLALWRQMKKQRARSAQTSSLEGASSSATASDACAFPRGHAFTVLYQKLFPDISKESRFTDLAWAAMLAEHWKETLRYYDVIQGYATDSLIPLYHGFQNFASYEHGTLREIPFEDSTQGRLCNITYRASPVIFVTNSDVLPSVDRLDIPRNRIVCLPHAFNDRRAVDFAAKHASLAPGPGKLVTFFAPARHHWQEGGGSWLKGNDRLIRAAAMVAGEGRRFKLQLVAWGAELEMSRRLIAELACEPIIEWLPVMRKRQLWTHYLEAHAVIDQFVIPALGGVAFEAMCLGKRVITRIDPETLENFFGKTPPVLNAAAPEEIAQQMRLVFSDPLDREGLGRAARDWILTWHGADRIVDLQLAAYRALLTESPSPAAPDYRASNILTLAPR